MGLFRLLFIAYSVSQLYVFIGFLRSFGWRWWLIPLGIIQAGLVAFSFVRMTIWNFGIGQVTLLQASYLWMGFGILAALCLLTADIFLLLRWGYRKLQKNKNTSTLPAAKLLRMAIGSAFLFFLYGIYAAYTPVIITIPIVSSKLPSSSRPLTIVQLSDVHIHETIGPWYLQRIATMITALEPDILVSTGDLVDSNVRNKNEEATILASIPAKLGKYAILGNHEKYHGAEQSIVFTRKAGFTVLRDSAVHVAGITIAGVDDVALRTYASDAAKAEAALFATLQNANYTILLKHRPNIVPASIGKFDLQMSGHTHNGQIWPGNYLTQDMFNYTHGELATHTAGKRTSQSYVSSGTGFWGPPMRFFTRPEIIIYTLSPAK